MSAPPRVLVTGGAGFVGSHVVERLAARGCRVAIVDNFARGKAEWVADGTSVYELDIRDAAAMHDAVAEAKAEIVVHLAALHYIPAVESGPEEAWTTNVGGTETLLRALAEHPPRVVVFASTAAVYPDTRENVSESIPPAPIDLYGRTKLAGEEALRDFARATGSTCVAARIFNVVGPRETNPHVVVEIVDQLRRGETAVELGNLEPQRDFVDVRDLADALVRLALDAPAAPTTFNIGSGRGVSVRELVRTCERILGRSVEIRVSPERTRTVERMRLVSDSSLIHRAVGWQSTTPLERTLAELLEAP